MSKIQKLEDLKTISVDDAKSIYLDLENLLENFKDDGSDNVKDLKSKLKEKLSNAKKKIDDFESSSKDKAICAYEQSRDYVKDNPATTTGIIAAVGVLVGLIAYISCCKNK